MKCAGESQPAGTQLLLPNHFHTSPEGKRGTRKGSLPCDGLQEPLETHLPGEKVGSAWALQWGSPALLEWALPSGLVTHCRFGMGMTPGEG